MHATRMIRLRVESLRWLNTPMPDQYTVRTLADVPDILGDYPGEMQFFTHHLGNEQVAFTYRRMPQHTGGKGGYTVDVLDENGAALTSAPVTGSPATIACRLRPVTGSGRPTP